jgi:ABC-type spermidine/putrescine transport system permease subunit I
MAAAAPPNLAGRLSDLLWRRPGLLLALLLAPPLLWLGAFAFAPLVLVALISFAGRGQPVAPELDGSAWARVLDPAWLSAFGRSLALAAATSAICLVCGAPLAVFIARRTERVRRVLYFLVLLPLWASSLALT